MKEQSKKVGYQFIVSAIDSFLLLSLTKEGKVALTLRLETLNPTSDAVMPIRLKKLTIEAISSASA